jgi:hypothetical protein
MLHIGRNALSIVSEFQQHPARFRDAASRLFRQSRRKRFPLVTFRAELRILQRSQQS